LSRFGGDGWPGDDPLLMVSTKSRAYDTLVNRRVNITAKLRPKPTQSVAGWTLSAFDLWLSPTWSIGRKHLCIDTIFGRIPNVLVVS
jgi:hypothetical protein